MQDGPSKFKSTRSQHGYIGVNMYAYNHWNTHMLKHCKSSCYRKGVHTVPSCIQAQPSLVQREGGLGGSPNMEGALVQDVRSTCGSTYCARWDSAFSGAIYVAQLWAFYRITLCAVHIGPYSMHLGKSGLQMCGPAQWDSLTVPTEAPAATVSFGSAPETKAQPPSYIPVQVWKLQVGHEL